MVLMVLYHPRLVKVLFKSALSYDNACIIHAAAVTLMSLLGEEFTVVLLAISLHFDLLGNYEVAKLGFGCAFLEYQLLPAFQA